MKKSTGDNKRHPCMKLRITHSERELTAIWTQNVLTIMNHPAVDFRMDVKEVESKN
ncbi:MAG: hypothetical protein WKI04_12505 [Ferruginibacter sp.]